MKKIATVLLASALMTSAGVASAADIAPPALPGPVVVTPVPAVAGFDWNRFYAGVQGGVWYGLDPLEFDSLRGAVLVGRNVLVGSRLVVGAEAVGGIYVYPGEILFEAYGLARAGVLLGERALVYGAAGAGFDFDPVGGGGIMLVGGGIELGLGERVGVRTEALALRYFGGPFSFLSGTVGLTWHFGGR